MKITESRLRRLIRQVIRETHENPPPPVVAYDEADRFYVGDIDDPHREQPQTEEESEVIWSTDISDRAKLASSRNDDDLARIHPKRIHPKMDKDGFVGGLDLFNDDDT